MYCDFIADKFVLFNSDDHRYIIEDILSSFEDQVPEQHTDIAIASRKSYLPKPFASYDDGSVRYQFIFSDIVEHTTMVDFLSSLSKKTLSHKLDIFKNRDVVKCLVYRHPKEEGSDDSDKYIVEHLKKKFPNSCYGLTDSEYKYCMENIKQILKEKNT
jgi:hypothetical protein